eukprot:m.82701 g.82701  ORF g.82701 m.82701 type:complete len:89 (-) comp12097_c1_seq1:1819-2085(-)
MCFHSFANSSSSKIPLSRGGLNTNSHLTTSIKLVCLKCTHKGMKIPFVYKSDLFICGIFFWRDFHWFSKDYSDLVERNISDIRRTHAN